MHPQAAHMCPDEFRLFLFLAHIYFSSFLAASAPRAPRARAHLASRGHGYIASPPLHPLGFYSSSETRAAPHYGGQPELPPKRNPGPSLQGVRWRDGLPTHQSVVHVCCPSCYRSYRQ